MRLACRSARILALACLVAIVPALDAQAAVERTQGSPSVSPRGTAQYSIPIMVPPGVNGMAPDLALVYSQETLNGLLGAGWSIAGLAEISRCSNTIALDGFGGPATLSASDAYCLGGNRLRLTGGTYGQVSATYQTAIETYSRATVTAANANGPTAWEVRKKDGLIYEFGNTADSRIEVVGSIAARAWALNRIADRSGNVIDFVYEEDASTGGYRPLEVRYGANTAAGTPHTTKVVFVYETAQRPDPIYRYQFGVKNSAVTGPEHEFKRLDRIDVIDIASAGTVRTYDLTYEATGGAGNRSRLASIQESRGSDTLLATTVTWTSGTAGWASSAVTSSINVPAGYLRADINGDNRTDLVFSSSTTSGSGTWNYALGSETGLGAAVATGNSNANYTSAQIVEWNGDGKADILVPCNGTGTWCVMLANGAGFGPLSDTGVSSAGTQLATDVNCDGLDDLVRLDTSMLPNRIFTRVRSGSGYAAETLAFTSPLSIEKFPDFNPMTSIRARSAKRKLDFNGDGCADFVMTTRDDDPEPGTPPIYYLAPFLGSSNGIQPADWIGGQTQVINTVAAGDFNGDGQTDLVRNYGTTQTVVHMGSGGQFSAAVQGPPLTGYFDQYLYVGDYDGDGLDDVVMPNTASFAWYVSRSNGNSFTTPTSLGYTSGATANPLDLNGDGGVDVVGTSGTALIYRLRNAPFPDYVDRITDGFGMYADFDYVRLTNAGSVYTPGTGSAFPVIEFQGPMYVVSRLTSTTGAGSTFNVDYTYEAARLHLQGHGFLGFAKRTQTDSRNGLRTEETYLQDTSRYEVLGAPALVEVKQGSGTLVQQTTLTWSALAAGSGSTLRRFPYISAQVVNQYELGGTLNGSLVSTTTTTADGVDATSGLVYDSKTTVLEASSANGAQPGGSYVRRVYHPTGMLTNDTTSWCIGQPGQTQEINSHTLFGGGAVTRTTDRTWDSTKCRVTVETTESGNATRQVTATIGYDSFGNVNSTSVVGRNADGTPMAARVSGADWGANGRFLRSSTNALTQQTTYGWDEAIGMRTSVTDPNLLQTSWTYDNFGRVTRENRPDGTATTFTYNDCASLGCLDGNNKVIVVQSQLDAGGATVRSDWALLDRLNRIIGTRTTLLSGSFARVERRYDSLGRVSQESAPCDWASCAFFWTVYTYDALNRVTQVSRPTSESNPAAASIFTFYEGLTTRTVDAQNKQTTNIATVAGVPARWSDPDGYYVQIDYDAFSHPVRIMDSASVTLETATFDVRGLRTAHGVLGAGARTFTYNSLGERVGQTDAKSQSTTFGYDPLGRMTSRADAQGTATWVWGASAAAKNIGRLESKTAATGVSESYLYDTFGRPSQTTTTLGSDGTYVYNYGYNTLGTLDSVTYPTSTSSYRLKLKYDYASGQLQRIRDFAVPATVFWQADATNTRGQITQETLGNGLVTTRNFDAVTGTPGFIRTGAGGGSAVQNLSYLWDTMGNLVQRQDANQGLSENFYYDNLYRVDYSQLNGVTNLDVGYDSHGYITSKQDASDTAAEGGTATWYANDLAATLSGTTAQNSGSTQFLYDADGSRYKQIAVQGSTTETTLYVGGLMERVTAGSVTAYRHYIETPSGTAAIYIRNASGTNVTYYTLHDHLGSIDKITSSAGTVTVALSYSAFGQRRGANWTGLPSAGDWSALSGVTHRGFTGHEHLDNMGLIHMNGRVYQPAAGRFLSSDPFIDDEQGTQAFNRYAYLGNGPLSGTDPTGFMEEVIVTASQPSDITVVGHRTGAGFTQLVNAPRGVHGPNYFNTTVVRHRELQLPAAADVLQEIVVTGARLIAPNFAREVQLEQLVNKLRSLLSSTKRALNGNSRWVQRLKEFSSSVNTCVQDKVGALGWAMDGVTSVFGLDTDLQESFTEGYADFENFALGTSIGGTLGAQPRIRPGGAAGRMVQGEYQAARLGRALGRVFSGRAGYVPGMRAGRIVGRVGTYGVAVVGAFTAGYVASAAVTCAVETANE